MAIDEDHLLNSSQKIAARRELWKSETPLGRIEDRLDAILSKIQSSSVKQISVCSLRGLRSAFQASIAAASGRTISRNVESDTPGFKTVALVVEESKGSVAVEVRVLD